MIRRSVLAAVLLAAVLSPVALAQAKFPRFTNYVVDQAKVLSDDAERSINVSLADYERRSTNQIAVALLESTGGPNIDDYANDLFEEWGIGEKDKDNGVLLVVTFEQPRELRIEVGSGLEGDLTDLESGRIRDAIVPVLQQGDTAGAIELGTQEIRRALGDEEVTAPPPDIPDDRGTDTRGIGSLFWIIPFLIFGPLSAIGRRGRRRRGWVTPIFWGGGWGGLAGGSSSGGFGGGGFGGGGGGGSSGGGASGGW